MYTNDLNALSLDNFMFLRLWSATAQATLLADSKQSRPISPVLPIITCSSVTMIRSRGRGAGLVAVTVRMRQTSQPSLSAAPDAQARMIAKRLLRNIAIKQAFCFGNFSPDSHERQPGLHAYLQAARATKVFLIKRNDNHGSYLARQSVKSSLRSRPCRFVAAWLTDHLPRHQSRLSPTILPLDIFGNDLVYSHVSTFANLTVDISRL
jgi:hypothetical protein